MNTNQLLPWFALAAMATASSSKAEETVTFDAAPAEGSTEGWGGSLFLSGGYATDFIFRGRNFGDNMGEGRAELAFPVGESASLNVGGKYAGADGYEEAQAFASLQQSFGAFTAALGYRWYGLDADNRNELGFLIGTALGGVDWSVGYFYDTELAGHYVEFMGQRSWQLFDQLSLRAGAGISGASNYWYGGSGFNNAVFRLDMPVTVRDWITLTPWISASIPMEAIKDYEDDTVFGGVNLQLSF